MAFHFVSFCFVSLKGTCTFLGLQKRFPNGHCQNLMFFKLISCGGGAIFLLSPQLEQEKVFPDAHGGAAVHSIAFAGSQLLSAGADGKVRVWDVNGVTGQPMKFIKSGEFFISSDPRGLASKDC